MGESSLASLGSEVVELKGRIGRLENTFLQFSGVLISTLEEGCFQPTEAAALRGVVRALLPIPKTKYYTWKVYEKYTMTDVEQMNEIANLIEQEGRETNRRGLIEYSWKLRYYAMVAKVVYTNPKLRSLLAETVGI